MKRNKTTKLEYGITSNKTAWLFLLGMILISVSFFIANSLQGVKNGDTITINYEIILEDGTIYYSSSGREPLEVTLGEGLLISGFEEEVIGMEIGDTKKFTLPPEKAYGEYRPDLVGTVERSWLPEGVEPAIGKQVQTELLDGTPIVAVITAFNDSTLTLDANHPLAGQSLTFDIELVGIGNNMTPSPGPSNSTVFGWMVLVFVALVAGFLFLKGRSPQLAYSVKNRTNLRRSKYLK